MKTRIITGSILTLVALVLLYFCGIPMGVTVVLGLSVAIFEEYRALAHAGHRPVSWPTWAALVASVPLCAIYDAKVAIPIIMGACLLTLCCVIFRKDPRLEDALMSLLPLLSIGLPALCMLTFINIRPLSVQRVYYSLIIVTPVLCDTLAYFIGSKIRGPKLCPAVSPNKTISGALGGMLGAMISVGLIALLANLTCGDVAKAVLPNGWQYLLMGVIGGVACQMGDLFASMVKRHCRIKDFSNIFPGHGGMLDRLDSIIFMGMTVYCFHLLTA